ncbi:hypothetical protein ACTTBA_07595 [Shewanella frigidimarina]|uniref:hypothetical protein n=1 Tax=Shewanella frigidimarina TaxID=56812 RepID=UPI003FA12751
MSSVEDIIKSVNVPINRDFALEAIWLYEDYSAKVDEALAYHCPNAMISFQMKQQISKLYHQGYVVIENQPIAVPVLSVFRELEIITSCNKGRKLKNITKSVGFEVLHSHFGQSSFIVENWVNHAKSTKLKEQKLSIENMYSSLLESVSKSKKTGEWVVYSRLNQTVQFWCLWLHEAGDEALIKILKNST